MPPLTLSSSYEIMYNNTFEGKKLETGFKILKGKNSHKELKLHLEHCQQLNQKNKTGTHAFLVSIENNCDDACHNGDQLNLKVFLLYDFYIFRSNTKVIN